MNSLLGGHIGSINCSRRPPRACERIESWIAPLSYDDVIQVRKVYQDVGFAEAFQLATQLRVNLKKGGKVSAEGK